MSLFKRLIFAAIVTSVLAWGSVSDVWACEMQTYMLNGRIVVCTVCCIGPGHCTVNCS